MESISNQAAPPVLPKTSKSKSYWFAYLLAIAGLAAIGGILIKLIAPTVIESKVTLDTDQWQAVSSGLGAIKSELVGVKQGIQGLSSLLVSSTVKVRTVTTPF